MLTCKLLRMFDPSSGDADSTGGASTSYPSGNSPLGLSVNAPAEIILFLGHSTFSGSAANGRTRFLLNKFTKPGLPELKLKVAGDVVVEVGLRLRGENELMRQRGVSWNGVV
ncbi:hypothetical protein P691DRAFT_811599 [Macrolepiota fuliginosa MF-IS2]|uniref:Uncharacterized protein n=1 Tax=Macrolepiota fuliginosa MF-IS2 TaxID=1400762 RepID=A0A9P5X1Y8_9AGAR|nr:hypothetical protein P691DRAFT_811599 [Macrolepiota fuliginosa MF-IS2]